MTLTDVERDALQSQIAKDALWCEPCAQAGVTRFADVRCAEYRGHREAAPFPDIQVCRDCFVSKLRVAHFVAMRIRQLEYIALLAAFDPSLLALAPSTSPIAS